MSSRVGVGIVGTGGIAREHARALTQLSDQAVLIASVYERTRHFVRVSESRRLADHLGLFRDRWSKETLQTLATIKANLSSVPDWRVDVGAHPGEFAAAAVQALRIGRVLCFEPNSDLHDELRRSLADREYLLRGCAVGDIEGEASFNIHADRSMSSLLTTDANILRREFNTYDTPQIVERKVPISTLDHELLGALAPSETFFLKVDVQGTELSVLRGATASFSQCVGMLVEYMFTTPFVGQAPFSKLVSFLDDHGFACRCVVDLTRKPTHHVSAVDFLFLRQC